MIEIGTNPILKSKMKTGAELISDERARHSMPKSSGGEGWTQEHDDTHKRGELGLAADSYLVAVTSPDEEGDDNGKPRHAFDWPWDESWWKPSDDPIRNLVKAGALIAAEIDRLQRLQPKPHKPGRPCPFCDNPPSAIS